MLQHLCEVNIIHNYTIDFILQVSKRTTTTPSATTSQATSTMHLEKSSGASADRRHYGKECGITQLVFARGEVIPNETKSTGQEVVFKRSGNEPEKTSQPQHPDVLRYSSLVLLHSLTNQLFSKLPPFTKGSTLFTN